MKRGNSGVTLLELVVAICVIFLLAGLTMPAVSAVKKHSLQTKAKSEITQLDTALMAFFADNGYFPEPSQMLASLSGQYFKFDDSRVNDGGKVYRDTMGEPYIYLKPGVISPKGYDLYSLGALKAEKDAGTIGRLLSGFAATLYTTGTELPYVVGDPGGLAGDNSKTIWGLAEPSYDMIILGALSLLRSTDNGFNLAQMINISNMPISWDETLIGTGTLAYYWPYETGRGIYLNPIFEDGPAEALAAVIAHEATHLAENLANGATDFDSIEQEYGAFYNEAMVWKQLTEKKTFTNLNDPVFVETHPEYVYNIVTQEENLALMMEGEENVKEDLRKRYPQWPEKDPYGSSYVVPKS